MHSVIILLGSQLSRLAVLACVDIWRFVHVWQVSHKHHRLGIVEV